MGDGKKNRSHTYALIYHSIIVFHYNIFPKAIIATVYGPDFYNYIPSD